MAWNQEATLFPHSEWTDWGTLQHEAALGCRVEWREWVVAFSAVWEAPYFVYDCNRAGDAVVGGVDFEELLEWTVDDVGSLPPRDQETDHRYPWDHVEGELKCHGAQYCDSGELEDEMAGQSSWDYAISTTVPSEITASEDQPLVKSMDGVSISHPGLSERSHPVLRSHACWLDDSNSLTVAVYLAVLVIYGTWTSMNREFHELHSLR